MELFIPTRAAALNNCYAWAFPDGNDENAVRAISGNAWVLGSTPGRSIRPAVGTKKNLNYPVDVPCTNNGWNAGEFVQNGILRDSVSVSLTTRFSAHLGLNTCLVDKQDFAAGTSSRSTKLIHGGVRYLQKAIFNFDLEQYNMVREALSERANLLDIAPHIAKPLPIMLPVYKLVFPCLAAGLVRMKNVNFGYLNWDESSRHSTYFDAVNRSFPKHHRNPRSIGEGDGRTCLRTLDT